jgi:hypothetical protein
MPQVEVCTLENIKQNIIIGDNWNELQKCYGNIKKIYGKKPYSMTWDGGKPSITQTIRIFCQNLMMIKDSDKLSAELSAEKRKETFDEGINAVTLWFQGRADVKNPLHKFLLKHHKQSFLKMDEFLKSQQVKKSSKPLNVNPKPLNVNPVPLNVNSAPLNVNPKSNSNESLNQENVILRRSPDVSSKFEYALSKGNSNYKLVLNSINPEYERYFIKNNKNKIIGYASLQTTSTKDKSVGFHMSPEGRIYNKNKCIGNGKCNLQPPRQLPFGKLKQSNVQPVHPLQFSNQNGKQKLPSAQQTQQEQLSQLSQEQLSQQEQMSNQELLKLSQQVLKTSNNIPMFTRENNNNL